MRLAGEIPLVVILGPTAVGKTGLGIEIAEALNGEIISADSRQVYRYMDIGTAKPTSAELAAAQHHMIDVVDPDENLSLAQYQAQAYAIIDELRSRGKLPLLVGGTGLYITAVVEGWAIPDVPPNLQLRVELEAFAEEHGSTALHERLRQLDPAAAEKIDGRNIRRVVRALEICIETGEPMNYEERKQPPAYPILQYGLTMDRGALYERADRRLDDMMRQGFVAEVRGLLERGYDRYLPSMSGLGYRQFAAHILDDAPLDEAIKATQKANRVFIRSQYGWFRGHDTGVTWLDIAEIDRARFIETLADGLET
jgi:tRNA dimethylallyltransferase